MGSYPGATEVSCAIFGSLILWRGMTDDIESTPMGTDIIPRWIYIAGGLLMLAFSVVSLWFHWID